MVNMKMIMETNELNFQIGIVVPCYNETNRIPLDEFEKHISLNPNHFFCFVNDGSTDTTLKMLELFFNKYPKQIYVLDNKTNLGKAETVKTGVNYLFSKQRFDIIGFLDADLATPLSEIERIMPLFSDTQKRIVIGSRIRHIGGAIERKFIRFIMGRIFATIVSNWLLKIPVYDTQCGFKFFRVSIIQSVFNKPFKSKWFFDIELLCRIIIEYPNTDINEIAQEHFLKVWKDKKGSKIKLVDYFKVPLELIKLKYYYRL